MGVSVESAVSDRSGQPAAEPDHPWIPAWVARVPVLGPVAVRLFNDRRVRYLLAGGIAAVVSYVLFAVGWLLFSEVGYYAVMVGANFLTAVTTYPLYRNGVHQVTGPWLSGFARFYVTCFWALLFGVAGMPLLVEVMGVPVLVAQAIVIILWPLINYQIHKHWAFKRG